MKENPEKIKLNETILRWSTKQSAIPFSVRIIFSLLILGIMAFLDYITGPELSFSIFYLVPVAYAGALISRRAGSLMAVAGAIVWGYYELSTGGEFSSNWIIFWNSIVRLGFFLIMNEFIYHLQRSYVKLRELSRKDSLTGIPNSRVFEESVVTAIESKSVFIIAYVDLDGFKKINDSFGHSAGDEVLREVASIITQSMRENDLVARLGGDEFAILLPNTNIDEGKAVIQRIFESIQSNTDSDCSVCATFGVVSFNRPPKSWNFALHQADILMYEGKGQGRNRILWRQWPSS